jgi:hypothetical protein
MRAGGYGRAVIVALVESPVASDPAVRRAIDFLRANLTDAALDGCHHCGEGDRQDAPCWWCGLRDTPRRIRKAKP